MALETISREIDNRAEALSHPVFTWL